MSSPNQPQHTYNEGALAYHTWSAKFEITPAVPKDEVIANLGRLVVGYGDPLRPISGAVMGTGNGLRTELILGLDPSETYGTPSVEECETIAADITSQFGWERKPKQEEQFGLRAIMGRRVGYDETAHTYTSDEVRDLAENTGRFDLLFAEGDLFSLRSIPDKGLWRYDEPGVVITGPADAVGAILRVAETMKQDRVVPEIPGEGTKVYKQND